MTPATKGNIRRSVESIPSLSNKESLILDSVDRVSVSNEIDDEWRAYIQVPRTAELEAIMDDENLKPDETRVFIERAFRDSSTPTTGKAITKILPSRTPLLWCGRPRREESLRYWSPRRVLRSALRTERWLRSGVRT